MVLRKWRWILCSAALHLAAPATVLAQQVNDPLFRFANPDPVFRHGEGPRVCVDEAHHNVHTISRRFAPFAEVLRSDGFRLVAFTQPLSGVSLETCDILVLAAGRATDSQSSEFWPYPHSSAYTRSEIDAVVKWVRGGGALLFTWDHAPAAGAAAGLANLLGVQTLDAWSDMTPHGRYPEIVRRADRLFIDHPIVRGRSRTEHIDSLATHGGGAFFPSKWIQPVVTYGREATAWVLMGDMGQGLAEIPESEWPRFDIEGWLLVGTRDWGEGRIVFLADSTLCTAQVYGQEATPIAMSHPAGAQNAQFCLNMIRWLGRVL